MDRRVKERLIGASILVALIVLVVPELLSGPKPAAGPPAATLPAATPEPIRNVTVDLSTSKPAANPDADAAVAPPASAAIRRARSSGRECAGIGSQSGAAKPITACSVNLVPASAAGARKSADPAGRR